MSKNIKIILLEDLAGYGRAGDITEASEGYARNFLFPQGKAALATSQIETKAAERKSQDDQAAKAKLAKYQQKAEELDGIELIIFARLKGNNEIFGKISERDISKALDTQANLTITAKDIIISEPITAVGTHDVTVTLSKDIEANIKVTIEPDPDSIPKNDEQE